MQFGDFSIAVFTKGMRSALYDQDAWTPPAPKLQPRPAPIQELEYMLEFELPPACIDEDDDDNDYGGFSQDASVVKETKSPSVITATCRKCPRYQGAEPTPLYSGEGPRLRFLPPQEWIAKDDFAFPSPKKKARFWRRYAMDPLHVVLRILLAYADWSLRFLRSI
mmetsp:Transcript_8178/g.18280  ORF Transcript_8178/g.18280 Transcript_8178/m.18280 type:complete len:165 (-) Transcript_8178:199-693(-)